MSLGRTVAELKVTIGAREFDRWWLYYAEEPWGPARDNLHAAIIASTIANVHRSKKTKAYEPDDFMVHGASTRRARDLAGRKALLDFLRTTAKGKRKQQRDKRKKPGGK